MYNIYTYSIILGLIYMWLEKQNWYFHTVPWFLLLISLSSLAEQPASWIFPALAPSSIPLKSVCSSPLPFSVQMDNLCSYTPGKGQSLTFAVSSVTEDSLCVRINERGQDGRRTSLRETPKPHGNVYTAYICPHNWWISASRHILCF